MKLVVALPAHIRIVLCAVGLLLMSGVNAAPAKLPVTIEAVGTSSTKAFKLIDELGDGSQDFSSAWTNGGSTSTNWFTLDLGVEKLVSEIRMAPRANKNYDFDITIGNTLSGGKVTGSPTTTCTPAQEGQSTPTFLKSCPVSPAATGRYVTIQRSNGGWLHFHATEVWGENAGSITLPIIFNFSSSDLSDWINVDEGPFSSNWSVVGGAFQQSNDVAPPHIDGSFEESFHLGAFSYLFALTSLDNYSIDVDINPLIDFQTVPIRVEGGDLGIMFRYQDSDNYYRIAFSTRESYARLEKKVGATFTTLATNSRGYLPGQSFHLSINLSGNSIQVTLDGDPLFAVSDADLTMGTVALYSQQIGSFDNLVIDVVNPEPTIVLISPLAHSVLTGATVSASALVTNLSAGDTVEFEFGGLACTTSTETPPGSGVFTSDCGTQVQGDYFLSGARLTAVLRDNGSTELDRDENTRIGILGDSYVALGDSITQGIFNFFASDSLSMDDRNVGAQGYQARLNDKLTTDTGYPNIVYNAGIAGDLTADTIVRIDSIMDRYPGENGALLMLGSNDSGGSTPLPQTTYTTNMQSIVDTVISAGKTVWVAKPPPALPFADSTSRNAALDGYGDAVDTLTGIQSGPDFFAFFYDDNGTPGNTSDDIDNFSMYFDALHPNSLAYRIMSDLWYNAISGSITEPFYLHRLCSRLVSSDCSAVARTDHKQILLELNNYHYTDETYTLTSIPAALSDGIWINTANGEDGATGTYIDFNVDRAVVVYIGFDAGASSLPDWLDPATSGYVDTGLSIGSTDPLSPTLDVYSQSFASGSISLNGNMDTGAVGADSNYIVVVVEQ